VNQKWPWHDATFPIQWKLEQIDERQGNHGRDGLKSFLVLRGTREAPRSKAAGASHDSMGNEVAVGMPCPSRSRAAGYND